MSFSLVTLPAVSLSTSAISESGTLVLECTSDPGEKKRDADVLIPLALRLGSRVFGLVPKCRVSLLISSSGERDYTFEPADGAEKDSGVKITVPPPTEDRQQVATDIETFDHILSQYTNLSWAYNSPEVKPTLPPPLPARPGQPVEQPHTNIGSNVEEHTAVQDSSLRGRLLLMDEASGDVVGELPEKMHLTEDPSLPRPGLAGDGAEPVVLEMHPDMYDACTGVSSLGAEGDDLLATREVFIRAVPPEEQDWLMKGATFISQAISSSTSLLVTGITSASNYYITHSRPGTPTPSSDASTPVGQSPSATNAALAKAHALSGQARAASTRTADYIEGMIRRAVGGKLKPASATNSPPPPATSGPVYGSPQGPPPPYAVYTPKSRPQRLPMSEKSGPTDSKEAEPEEPEEPAQKKPLRRIDRVLLSADLVLTTVDDSARRVFEVSSDRLGAVVGHKYGRDAQQSTHLATHTARNIVLVYVDMRGFARRALITKTGKEFVKARFNNNKKNGGATTSANPSPGNSPSPSPSLAPEQASKY